MLAFASLGVHSQVKIGVNLGPPDPSAVLEVESTQGGLLLPRLTTIQRNAIANPAAGLVIFNLDTHCENFFNGQSWRQLCGTCDFPDPQPVISGNFCLGDTLTLGTPQVGQNGVYQYVEAQRGEIHAGPRIRWGGIQALKGRNTSARGAAPRYLMAPLGSAPTIGF